MFDFIKKLVEKSSARSEEITNDRYDATSKSRTLELELEESSTRIEELKSDLQRLRFQEPERVKELTDIRFERLISSLAAPVAYLKNQEYLLLQERQSFTAKDVLTVSDAFVEALKEEGMEILGSNGEATRFNAAYHLPSDQNDVMKEGLEVVIKLVGIQFKGKVIRKASVVRRNVEED